MNNYYQYRQPEKYAEYESNRNNNYYKSKPNTLYTILFVLNVLLFIFSLYYTIKNPVAINIISSLIIFVILLTWIGYFK